MSIASRITEMEGHIENVYNMLELGGADLTNVDKNIFNIEEQIKKRYFDYIVNGADVIWNNWEKVTATDVTEATLNDTDQAPMKIKLKGNTVQDGTPTPDNPIVIQNVVGNVELKIQNSDGTQEQNYPFSLRSKNLFDLQNGEQGGMDTEGKETSSVNNWRAKQYIKVKPNTTYIFSIDKTALTTSTTLRIYEYDENKQFLTPRTVSGDGDTQLIFTTRSNTSFIKYTMYVHNVVMNLNSATTLKPQIEKGITRTNYELYYNIIAMKGTTLQDDGSHQKRGQVDLSTLSWTLRNTNTTTGISTYMTSLAGRKRSSDLSVLCSHFQYLGEVAGISQMYDKDEGISFYYNQSSPNTTSIYLNTKKATLAELQDWLNEENPIMEYELAEEEIIPYSETQQEQYNAIQKAYSYTDQTNISQTSEELPFILDIEALKKI